MKTQSKKAIFDSGKMLFKRFKLEIKSTKVDKENGVFEFEGYASVFNIVDHGRDRVMPGAFTASITENGDQRKALWQHRSSEPIGMFTIKEDGKGLFVTGRLPTEDDFVRGRIVPQLKIGSVDSLSIGYRVEDWSYNEDEDVWSLEKLDLIEVSLVTFPMLEEAIITALKHADLSQKWDKSKAEKEIEDPKLRIAGNLIAAKVDNEIMVIPRAVFAARIAMAKGSPTDSEKKELNEVYTSLNLDAPFEDGSKICVDELQNLSKSDRAWAIRNLKLSTNASNFLSELIGEATKGKPKSSKDNGKPANPDEKKAAEIKSLSGLSEINSLLKN